MTCQQMYKTLQEELTTKAKQEEHSKASARLAENELELTRTLLRQSKDEVAALTRERYCTPLSSGWGEGANLPRGTQINDSPVSVVG